MPPGWDWLGQAGFESHEEVRREGVHGVWLKQAVGSFYVSAGAPAVPACHPVESCPTSSLIHRNTCGGAFPRLCCSVGLAVANSLARCLIPSLLHGLPTQVLFSGQMQPLTGVWFCEWCGLQTSLLPSSGYRRFHCTQQPCFPPACVAPSPRVLLEDPLCPPR